MQDYGREYRKAFLEKESVDRKHERQVYWLLLISSTYVIIHIAAYLWRNYA